MNEQIDIIIAKKLSGEVSKEDTEILDAWLAADDRNKAEYEQVAKFWQNSDDLFNDVSFNTPAAWDKVAAKTIDAEERITPKRTIVLPGWTKYVIGAAAILILGIFLVKPLSHGGIEVVLADAGNKVVELPDHSQVTLRKGSKLTYPKEFAAGQRNVTLEGEAFFQVTRNEHKPFVIDAQSASVKVLGTSFNVKCDKATAKVTVATGRVQMTSKQNASQFVILTKGEFGNLEQNHISESTVEGSNYLFWKTGILQYDNKPLRYIAEELAYYYQKPVTIDAGVAATIQDQLINISFNNESIEKVLDELCLVAQCKWQQKDGQYQLLAK